MRYALTVFKFIVRSFLRRPFCFERAIKVGNDVKTVQNMNKPCSSCFLAAFFQAQLMVLFLNPKEPPIFSMPRS